MPLKNNSEYCRAKKQEKDGDKNKLLAAENRTGGVVMGRPSCQRRPVQMGRGEEQTGTEAHEDHEAR